MSTNSLVLSTFGSNAIDTAYHSGKLASMSIDEDLSLLMSRLPEPERLTTGKAATWPSAIHVLVRVLLALREDMRAMKEHDGQAQASRLFPHQEAAFLTIERQRVAGLLSSAFGTVGTIEDQIEAIRCIVAEAQMEARGVRELERQVQHEQARWARIQPLIRALHLWEGADITTAQGQLRMLEAQFEAWQRAEAEAAALDGEYIKPRGPLTRAEAAEIARRAASGPNRPNYYMEPFEPEPWVVDALIMLDRELRSAVLVEDAAPPLKTVEIVDPDTGRAAHRLQCSGAHPAPPCDDRNCWRREKPAEVTAPGKVSARPAEGVVRTLPDRVYRLIAYVEEMARQIMIDGGRHGLSRIVLSPDAALQYGVTPGNPMTARVGSGDVEITAIDALPVEASRPTDPTTASIEAGARERADLRERLDAANAQTKEWMEQCRAAETEVRRLGDELGNLRVHIATVTGERNQAVALANDARRERAEALAQRQKLLDDGLAARLLADAMLEAVKPLLPNGCKLDPDSIKVAIADYVADHDNLVRAVKVIAEDLR